MIDRFTMPKLGNLVEPFPAPWKPCGMGFTQYGLITCLCDNESRRHSKVYVGKILMHDDTRPGSHSSNETIGNPIEMGSYVALVGENGHLWGYDGQNMLRRFATRFANAAAFHNGALIVLDTDNGKIKMRDGLTMDGYELGTMPGDGIAMSASSFNGNLYAAVADSDSGACGLSCSDGSLRRLPGCQCVIPFAGDLVYSSMNAIYTLKLGLVTRLECEKIMDMKTAGNHLYIAGANPDGVWVANARGEIALVGRVDAGNTTVGGSCFRVRVAVNALETEGYFARTADGNRGEVYQIVWG